MTSTLYLFCALKRGERDGRNERDVGIGDIREG
jgi:hypothetical protein